MTDRYSRLIAALRDPARTQSLRERFKDEPAVVGAVSEAVEALGQGDAADFSLRTGGALLGPVWDQILEAVDQDSLKPGDYLGRYAVLEHVGSGGMGAVYAAYDSELDRKVALKVLHTPDVGEQEALLTEARTLAKLDHPNVVTAHDVGNADEQVFLAMEFIDGPNLQDWAADRSWQEVCDAYVAAGRGLEAAHEAGLVHRDFKPANVLIGATGTPRVVDFGLAQASSDHPVELIGTPGYMAPEMVLERRFDERSDQFAFAVSLWEALYGERPYGGADLESMAASFGSADLAQAAAQGAGVPQRIRVALERALSVDPDDRYPDMESLLAALVDDSAARTRRRLMAAVPAVVVLGLLTWLALRPAIAVCAAASDQLAGVWDEQVAERLKAAFDAGLPGSDAAFTRTSAALDAYASEWASMHTDSCEATNVRGDQSQGMLDLRTACLNRRRTELAAAVDTFLDGDAQVLAGSIDTVLALEPLAVCADLNLLAGVTPRPTDADAVARLDTLETRLAEVRVLADSRGPSEGLEPARELATTTAEFGYEPLTAEAWYDVGMLEQLLGNYDAAEDAWFRSWEAAGRGAHDEYVIRSLVRLGFLEGNDRGDVLRADRYAGLTDAAIERAQPGPAVRAEYHNSRGSVLQRTDRLEESMAEHQAALALREQAFGRDHYEVAKSLNNLGNTYQSAGLHSEALALFERGFAIMRDTLGEHSHTATLLSGIGAAHASLLDFEAAVAAHEEALAMRRNLVGDDGFMTAESLVNVAFAKVEIDAEAALAGFLEADEILALYLPDDHWFRLYPKSGQGRALFAAGRYAEAIPVLRESSEAWVAAGTGVDLEIAGDFFRLAQALEATGAPVEESLAAARQAEELVADLGDLAFRDQLEAWIEERQP